MSGDGYHDYTILHQGRLIKVEFWYDSSMGPPWQEHDGNGPVRDTRRKSPKGSGERLLSDNFAYDWQEAIKIAKREGWGLDIKDFTSLMCSLRRVPTKGQVAECAVERDYRLLRGWLNDEWHWAGVTVEDVETGVSDHCGGFESTDDYMREYAIEMCEGIYVETVERLLEGHIMVA